MTILLMCLDSRNPSCCHVFPPSVDLNTPSPHGELCRFCGSPVPTHTTLGFDCETVTSPMDAVVWSSKTGSKVIPRLVVFHTPPDAVAT